MRQQETAEGEFFSLLATLRELRGGFQSDDPSDRTLAKIAKVSPTTVGNWLRGEQFPQDISKLLKIVHTIAAHAASLGMIGSGQFSSVLVDDKNWERAYRDEARRRAEVVSESVQRTQASRTLMRLRQSTASSAPNDDRQSLEEPLMPSPEELQLCLVKLGIAQADAQAAAAWVEASATQILSPFPTRRPGSFDPPYTVSPESAILARGFLDDLLNLIQPQRMFTSTVYFSHGKVARYFRAHHEAMTEAGFWDVSYQASAADKFLALHRYLSSRGMLVSATMLQLLGELIPQDLETLFYFTGNFSLIPSTEIPENLASLQQAQSDKSESELHGLVARIFAATDPFFYPMVQFSGDFQGRKTVMVLSRKYLDIDSRTSTALGRALCGTPLPIAGFGTTGDSFEIHPFVLKLMRRV